MDDEAIRSLVSRLSRKHPSGGEVIGRAAIMAEGADLKAVVQWIIAHDGQPEASAPTVDHRGLHTSRLTNAADGAATPVRYVLPAGALVSEERESKSAPNRGTARGRRSGDRSVRSGPRGSDARTLAFRSCVAWPRWPLRARVSHGCGRTRLAFVPPSRVRCVSFRQAFRFRAETRGLGTPHVRSI